MVFQFHKVQLKVKRLRKYYETKLFQFHKVQLKAQYLSHESRYLGFQFHKVQLKGRTASIIILSKVVSIP